MEPFLTNVMTFLKDWYEKPFAVKMIYVTSMFLLFVKIVQKVISEMLSEWKKWARKEASIKLISYANKD